MRKFIKASILLAAAAALSLTPSAAPGLVLGPTGLDIIAGPYLQNVTPEGVTVMWETNLDADSIAEAGLDQNSLTAYTGQCRDHIHTVTITGLQPETAYYYRVRSSKGLMKVKSKVHTFRTAVRPDSPFAFVVMGDSRTPLCNPVASAFLDCVTHLGPHYHKLTEMAFAERPGFVINVGDVVTFGAYRPLWRLEYLWPAQLLMENVPVYVSIGNHEYYNFALSSDLFNEKKENTRWFHAYSAFPGAGNYYSFDYGNAHFTIVDSNNLAIDDPEQLAWLEKDLASSQARWKFVVHHHPLYSSDLDEGYDARTDTAPPDSPHTAFLAELYEKYGVDVVFYGHIHDYERTWQIKDGKVDPDGVIYIQTGGGGAELENFAPQRTWFAAKVHRGWQYCYVTIDHDRFRMEAYGIDGGMYDFLDLTK